MTKLEEEINEAYESSYDHSGELHSDELIASVAEVAKRYIEKAYRDGFWENEIGVYKPAWEQWLKDNGVI